MTRRRTIALATVTVVVVALIGGYWYVRPLLLTGTGYAAHNACALHAIAGRDDPENDLPPNPLVPVMSSRLTDDDTAARAAVLGVLARQTAWATPGFGCTLADSRPTGLPAPTPVTSSGNPYTDAPLTSSSSAGVDAALAHGFGDDLDETDRAALGTRGIVVLHQGKLVAERYAAGFDPTTPQLGWSMTKSVTNLMVGRLVQQGQVSLDDDHLRSEWTDERSSITIRQLMQMTSGLAWDETYDLGTPITKMLYLEPDMGSYVAAQPLAHEPGTYLQYSSGSTTLLCAIVTKDRGLADTPRREVFAPLGLSSAVLEPDATGTPVFALQDGSWNGRQLLPAGWMSTSTTAVDTTVEEGADGYASGWWSNARPDGSVVEHGLPPDAYFAEGHDGQWVIVVPSAELVVARLGFTPVRDDDRAVSTAADLVKALG